MCQVRYGRLVALGLVVLLAGCAWGGSADTTTTPPSVSPSPRGNDVAFPTVAFTNIGEGPVSEGLAREFQAALNEMSEMVGGGGMAATVMSPEGTWSGATGKANTVRDVVSTISSPSTSTPTGQPSASCWSSAAASPARIGLR